MWGRPEPSYWTRPAYVQGDEEDHAEETDGLIETRPKPPTITPAEVPNAIFGVSCTLAVLAAVLIAGVLYILPYVDGTWDGWTPATCMPDDCFCEKPRGNLMQQPVDTWSNFAFVLVGVFVIMHMGKNITDPSWGDFWYYSLAYGVGLIIMGTGSAFYHCSLTFIGQFIDNLGMFLIVCWAFALDFVRIKRVGKTGFLGIYLLCVLGAAYVNWYYPVTRRYAFLVMVLSYIALEIFVDWLLKPKITYRYFFTSMACIALGLVFWTIDLDKIVCWPESLYQGHAVWHVLDALCSFYLYWFMNSMVVKPGSPDFIAQEVVPIF